MIEAKRQVRAISFLYCEVADQRRYVLHDLCVSGHQEVDHDINGWPTATCLDLTHQLEPPEFFALLIPVAQQCFDQMDVFPISQGCGIQAKIHIQRTDVRHVLIAQQQPWHSTADDGETPLEAAEDLPDFDEY